jgi:type IV/VI secretion system ImpK/VasF family protein
MYRACAEALSAAAMIGSGGALPAPEALRQNMIALLRQLVMQARELGVSDAETAEARYPIVAFIDEQVLRSHWPGRAEWMSQPLQLQFYRETTAGENFYGRMRALTARGGQRLALEVYFMCIALGFVGAPPGGGGAQAARAYAEAARPQLLEGLTPSRIAPSSIPSERRAEGGRTFPVGLAAAVGGAAVCVIALVSLHFVLGQTLERARRDVVAASPAPTPHNGP